MTPARHHARLPRAGSVLIAALVVGALGLGRADAVWALDAPMVSAEVRVEPPTTLGLGVLVELPGRVRADLGLGMVPQSFAQTVTGIVESIAPPSDASFFDLVGDGLSSGRVVRLRGGWRPIASSGLYVHAGWSLWRTRTTGDALLPYEGLVGQTWRSFHDGEEPARPDSVGHHAVVHVLEGEVGWGWRFGDHLTMRLGLSYGHAVAARTLVGLRFDDGPQDTVRAADFEQQAATELRKRLVRYVQPVGVVLAFGWDLAGG
jgi:hypothetical protein